ncbi:MAG: FHA domain-containing protein [Planctomycetota bacterium]|nr:FHA domain-containing protein [Planctomycetota bacterium]
MLPLTAFRPALSKGFGLISLTVLRGSHKGEVLELPEGGSYRIGRRPSTSRPLPSPLKFEDRKMSRRHAEVCWLDGAWYLVDLHSTNGTFVNRKRMEGRMKLREGDLVQMGDTLFAVGDPAPHLKPADPDEPKVAAKPAKPVARPDKPGAPAKGLSEDDAADVISAMIAGEDELAAPAGVSLKDSLDLDGSEVGEPGSSGSRTGAGETSAGLPALLDDDDDDDGMVGRAPSKPEARRREAEPGKLDAIDELDDLLVKETEAPKAAVAAPAPTPAKAPSVKPAPKPAPVVPPPAAVAKASDDDLDLSDEPTTLANQEAEGEDLSDLDLAALGSAESAKGEQGPAAEILLDDAESAAEEPTDVIELPAEPVPRAAAAPVAATPAASEPATLELEDEVAEEPAKMAVEPPVEAAPAVEAIEPKADKPGKMVATKAEEEVGLSMWAAPVDEPDTLDLSVTGPAEDLAVGKPAAARAEAPEADIEIEVEGDAAEVVDLSAEPAAEESVAHEGLIDIDAGLDGEAISPDATEGLSEAESLADEIADAVISEDKGKRTSAPAKPAKAGRSKWVMVGVVGVVLAVVGVGAVFAFRTAFPRPTPSQEAREQAKNHPPAPSVPELPKAPDKPATPETPANLPPPGEVERNGTIDGAPTAPPSTVEGVPATPTTPANPTTPPSPPAPTASTPDVPAVPMPEASAPDKTEASPPEKPTEKPAEKPAEKPSDAAPSTAVPGPGSDAAKPSDFAPSTQPVSHATPHAAPKAAPAAVAAAPIPAPPLAGTAFLLDASGAQIDAFPLLISQLDGMLARMGSQDRFTVIVFQGGKAIELGPAGLRAATPAAHRQVIDALKADPAKVTPHGSPDADQALRLALNYHVREIHLLSDRPTVGKTPGPEPIFKLLDQFDPARRTQIHAVHFFYADSRDTLRSVASRYHGTYRFVEDKQVPGSPVGVMDAVLLGASDAPARRAGG